ncbi:MAG: helix-turn-helix domain-containing protein [Hydrogenophaga sp.]|jgi:transcriptional regulator with XRE-family HTH domain|uniref:helix-turn-helix domain-containing protein n=1 Tax=Hydrogenophaga sp. TaxID=1904254 RepID=UPI001DDA06B8|nr:helix-turn-helix transcriptional regulator [Hydrogenophaga sp.]MBW0169645.1 helix-turn-helix domain-containing protein [Hydrogenophaga sp.]MBW0183267.1 helix-turn-helix domain-containing protein [Hydrogenophaga sp.]
MKIGKALKLCRTAKALSLETVAERAGISVSYLSRLENDKREPTLALIGKVAEALDVPVPIVIFLASDSSELEGLDKETAQRFSKLALDLLRQE